MHKFFNAEKLKIVGRGLCFITKNPSECQDFSHILKKPVEINGEMYKVTAVERFAHCPPWRRNEPIGLMVKLISTYKKE